MVPGFRFCSGFPVAAALLLLPCIACSSQEKTTATGLCAPPFSQPIDKGSNFLVIRWITDPGTDRSWLLVRDGKRPAAPGRLIAASSDLNATGATPAECAAFKRALLIHAGDSVIAEEHTGSVDARLEAIALTGAAAGDQLTVRLKIGGRIFRARAIAPGRAVMLASREARP